MNTSKHESRLLLSKSVSKGFVSLLIALGLGFASSAAADDPKTPRGTGAPRAAKASAAAATPVEGADHGETLTKLEKEIILEEFNKYPPAQRENDWGGVDPTTNDVHFTNADRVRYQSELRSLTEDFSGNPFGQSQASYFAENCQMPRPKIVVDMAIVKAFNNASATPYFAALLTNTCHNLNPELIAVYKPMVQKIRTIHYVLGRCPEANRFGEKKMEQIFSLSKDRSVLTVKVCPSCVTPSNDPERTFLDSL